MYPICSWRSLPVLLVVALAGCGKIRPLPVSGIVKLDGQPVQGAVVTFHPEQGSGRVASGTTDSEGRFALTTLESGDGAFPGDYKVTVQYSEGVVGPAASNMRDAFTGMQEAAKKRPTKPRYVVPASYGLPDQTDLRQKVPAGGEVVLEVRSN